MWLLLISFHSPVFLTLLILNYCVYELPSGMNHQTWQAGKSPIKPWRFSSLGKASINTWSMIAQWQFSWWVDILSQWGLPPWIYPFWESPFPLVSFHQPTNGMTSRSSFAAQIDSQRRMCFRFFLETKGDAWDIYYHSFCSFIILIFLNYYHWFFDLLLMICLFLWEGQRSIHPIRSIVVQSSLADCF